MNDDLNEFEQRLARHGLPQPPADLRRRIVALPGRVQPAFAWHSIAAAVLAVIVLTQMIASTPHVATTRPEPGLPASLVTPIRRLDLPLDDEQTRQLANTLAAGTRLRPLPELHGMPAMNLSMGDVP